MNGQVRYMTRKNFVVLRNTEDGEVWVRNYDEDMDDAMMREVSKVICFSDCDDWLEILMVVYHGREVKYVGWQPGMVYEFVYKETGDVAWTGCFPNFEH